MSAFLESRRDKVGGKAVYFDDIARDVALALYNGTVPAHDVDTMKDVLIICGVAIYEFGERASLTNVQQWVISKGMHTFLAGKKRFYELVIRKVAESVKWKKQEWVKLTGEADAIPAMPDEVRRRVHTYVTDWAKMAFVINFSPVSSSRSA